MKSSAACVSYSPSSKFRPLGSPMWIRHSIDWLRTGYPEDEPLTGYSSLIALNGPISLTDEQTQEIASELELRGKPCDSADIGVAITKTTDRVPTATQVRGVAEALEIRRIKRWY